MKIIKKYFLHRIKKALPLMLVFMASSAIITALSVHSNLDFIEAKDMRLNLWWASAFLSLFAMLIPVLECSEFKNRRNLDTLYSFPISRVKMAISVYLSGLFQLFCIFSNCPVKMLGSYDAIGLCLLM